MATIATPQVLVFQEFNLAPSEITDPLRAHISGPNGKLHRYNIPDEKALIDLGEYDRTSENCYSWPGREAGSIVDQAYTRLYIDNALLMYHEDLIGITSNGRGAVQPVAGRPNWVRSTTLAYKSNGASYPRSSLFYDRDVQVGDRVYIRGVDGGCDEFELWTYVTGFASETVAGSVGDAREDDDNEETTMVTSSIEQTDGPVNCLTVAVNPFAYDGLPSGYVEETYRIEVIKSSVAGCNAARLRIISASGTDDVAEVEPAALGDPTAIGTRGLTVTWSMTGTPSCSSAASEADVTPDDFVVGQVWEVTVSQNFYAMCATSAGTYAGAVNDVYVIEVTKGGVWADLPEITVTTVKGLDYSGPTEVTDYNVQVPVGTNGVLVSFNTCACGMPYGLRKGDRYYITVTADSNGRVSTLQLRHDLPVELWEAEDLDLRLFMERDIEVSANRLSNPPLLNYEQEEKHICVHADITAYESTWTNNGVELPLPVRSGRLFVQYREWLAALTTDVGAINDVADLDAIPGQLHEDNPLKWGVYNALLNSNGTLVRYTAVADPTSLDSWQDVIERIDGRDDIYNLVPLTYDADVRNLFIGHVNAESSAEAGNWKGIFVNLLAKNTKMIVGQSSADAQLLRPTSTDGAAVLAVLEDDPLSTDTQYTRLRVPAANANFITYGVQPGDVVRFLYSTDAWGTESYTEFVVDEVLSENILLLLDAYDVSVNEPQRIEVWHTLSKNEIIDDLKDQAQALANRRVCAVWPDYVGTGGNTVPGYHLCCALAGLVSGVAPHQGLTHVEVAGFDDYARSTKLFSASQLGSLQDGGVWIVTEDRDGTPNTYHALTTNVIDVYHREEMVRRNVDSISYLFLRRLRPFIGRTNVTPSMLSKLRYEVEKTIEYLTGNGFTDDLGSQLISGDIRILRRHPLLADRVEIVLDLVVPVALNNIELHLVV